MNTFRPTCTLPGTPGGFVNASNVRSTMDIIWSCIGIIILSTWSILHPNIPPDFRKQAKWQLCLQKLYSVARKALWMIVMFVAPEALTSLYAHKMFSSQHNDTFLEKLAADQKVPWSRTHTLFADMGGFAIYFSDEKEFYLPFQKKNPEENTLKRLLGYFKEFKSAFLLRTNGDTIRQLIMRPKRNNDDFIDRFGLKQEFFFGWFGSILWERHLEHESIAIDSKNELSAGQVPHWKLQTLAALSGDIWVLDSAQLIAAVKGGLIKLPKITKKELQDKSKSDALVKTLAIMQVLWLIIQLAARKYYGLASAPFEISTAALSASTIILYVLEWNKPKDVNTPIYIRANKVNYSHETTESQERALSQETVVSQENFRKVFEKVFEVAPYPYLRFPIIPTKLYQIPSCAFHVAWKAQINTNDSSENNNDNVWLKTTIIAVASILSFGGIHIFAWNFVFPTKIEQLLWRVCSVAATFLPLPYLATHYPFMKDGTGVENKKIHQIRAIQAVFAFFYVLARLFLIIESLRSLYYLPREAFESTWSVNFPHWG
ncbi:hypothetical protein GGI35DRAFT_446247 [Trichoderma velutinum]